MPLAPLDLIVKLQSLAPFGPIWLRWTPLYPVEPLWTPFDPAWPRLTPFDPVRPRLTLTVSLKWAQVDPGTCPDRASHSFHMWPTDYGTINNKIQDWANKNLFYVFTFKKCWWFLGDNYRPFSLLCQHECQKYTQIILKMLLKDHLYSHWTQIVLQRCFR